ncbi:Asp23/Gls24 family envelope stress response protein [Streptomyces hygroscopicus]|uniref:Asp23/Gls24 family envelope stress response protein n=1 Tax=Streptomyces hygroscopicus TaxID=1912 RepID=UPI001FCBA005|nr:Asp23/Gls24 family envelope stress response protein [Streptomyces hygroscopicus]BDH13261.1 stress protein [Streptomyces hygroscopicus]
MTEIAERGSRKAGDLGRTTIADGVVAKIAFLAAGEVVGVHALGSGISRSVGALRKRVPGGGTTSTHGVKVEVGEKQAAVDLDVVVDYGEVIPEVGKAVRENVISSVERMTGLEVVEVNIAVSDVWLPEEEEESERVQ